MLGFVEAARRAGVSQIVYLSQLHAAKNSPVRFLRYHAVVEDAISSSGMAFTHLRPNLYMQGLLLYAHYRRGEASTVSTAVLDVTGHPARSFLTFARDYKRAFSN